MMPRQSSWLRSVTSGLISKWQALDYVPDCPACQGSGEPQHKYRAWTEQVYWRGELILVCHNCKGTGKV